MIPGFSPEACSPPVSITDILNRLSASEIRSLAIRFYGRDQRRFEELICEMWAERSTP